MDINDLERYGISKTIVEKLLKLGYRELTDIQKRAIEAGLFDKESLVVSAPTGTGKTFIGELAALIASTRKELGKTFFLVPLKALAEEKYEDFQNKYSDWGLKTAISTADRAEYDDELIEYDVIISTYEKLNVLLVRQPNLIRDIGLVVIDELQTLGDETRGLVIEILLTRLLMSRSNKLPQIIGLSATVPNAVELADWLEAKLVETTNREVELREGILYTGKSPINFLEKVLENGDFIYREFNTGNIGIESKLGINTIEKIAEISKNEQSIVFVDTQGNTQKVAERIANGLPSTVEADYLIDELDSEVESTPPTRALKKTLQNGVAFHHAGLLPTERRIIEDGFEKGNIRVICATTTLGAGVNTPAKNVVLLSQKTRDGKSILTREYKNMSGRAGRIRTKDDFGRSVLFAESEKEVEMLWKEYVIAQPERVESQVPKHQRLGCAILGLFASKVCSNTDELTSFLIMSFLGHTYYKGSAEDFQKYFIESIEKELKDLMRNGFLETDDGKIIVTELGIVCAEELLFPDTISLFYNILKESESKLKRKIDPNSWIDGIIHLCCCSPDASLLWEPRSTPEIEELKAIWELNKTSYLYKPRYEIDFLKSLRTTRMLRRWIEGLPLGELAAYAPQGTIKRTAENISWILRGLTRVSGKPLFDFSEELHSLIETLSERVYYGVKVDALPIMRLKIPAIHRNRASRLAESGFRTIDDLIQTSMSDLMSVDGFDEKLSLRIKEHVEKFIDDEMTRHKEQQMRRAIQLGRNSSIIEQLYTVKGGAFERFCIDIMKDEFGLNALYIGDADQHEPDGLVRTDEGNIVIECKRKEKGNVTAREAEEILGKGAKHEPIAYVTIGFPDFVEEAKTNVQNTKITLMKVSIIGEMLLQFLEGKIKQDDIIKLLSSGTYIRGLYKTGVRERIK